ncbi:hypothetical protein F5X99DRAFT_377173 [Biscogniauxia marginata]|nr:hypothetical protein F5X99DRAFT_377173 [Biscogniauxia marginata]
MTTGGSQPVVLYDIASGPPVTAFAPNPWKARYALNFKGINYRTEWVDLPDVASVRKSLGAKPVRYFDDGEPFYTLPVLKDTSTDALVGDSFDIATYLDKTYPNGHKLFPPSTVSLHVAFNAQVDAIFSANAILFLDGMLLNPETAEASKAEFCRRMRVKHWDELTVRGEERAKTLENLKNGLAELAKVFERTEGPFLEGETPMYADFIVGGWLMMLSKCLAEWDQVSSWQGGIWGKLHEALEPYSQVK